MRHQNFALQKAVPHFPEYKVWLAITENTKDHNWRVSMRSRHIPVNEIANKYNDLG